MMKTEISTNKDGIASCAAYLANNIQFVCDDLEPSRQGAFVQCANSILVMILPRFHRGEKIQYAVETGSILAEVALLKLMQLQSQELIKHAKLKNPEFAEWMSGCLMGFISKAAKKYADRQLNNSSAEYLS